jgi:organic hydroperoxide reductase OsmC/OhrA/SAM-dependent methyltransferase
MAAEDDAHRYHARCSWRGSTGTGYRSYPRSHRGQCPPAPPVLALSADPAYRGDPARLNPEQLVVLAAASCQLLSFLAEAARAGVDVVAYDDEASGEMQENDHPQRITAIALRPRITVLAPAKVVKVRELVEDAHRLCYIANSLRTPISLEPVVRVVPAPRGEGRPRYAFGETEAAARRLARLAEVFEATSREFLREAVRFRPQLALDLGCGPGHTTHLLAEVTGTARAIGIDSSRPFVEAAGKTASELVSFLEHDVTAAPLPVAGADLIYARFLVAHLGDAEGAVAAWASQLAPGGVLAVEEVEWIRTANPVFSTYLAEVAELLATRGAELHVGPRLHLLTEGQGWRQRSSRLRVLEVPGRVAAKLFSMNLAVWRSDPATGHVDRLEDLASALQELAAAESIEVVSWALRQATLERVQGLSW